MSGNETICKIADNEIYNTDCADGLKMLCDESIDLTVTSPPYDDLRTYDGYVSSWNFDKFKTVASELFRVTKTGGTVVWIVNDSTLNGSETGNSFRQALYFMECGFKLHDTMIWQKISPYQHKTRYIQCFEYMFVFVKGKIKTANLICDRKNKYAGVQVRGSSRARNGEMKPLSEKQKSKFIKEYGARFNVWDIPPTKHNETSHPAVFSEAIANDHIKTWSNEDDTVLDPFMGSGTTAMMAMLNGRKYIGFEINSEYCEEARKRIRNAKMGVDVV